MDHLDFLLATNRHYKNLAMFGALLLSATGTFPIPEEIILISSGLAVGWNDASFLFSALACVLGIVAGDCFLFVMGRCFGRWFLSRRPVRWIFSARQQERVSRLFDRHGSKTVFIGRFFAGARFGIFIYAGQHGMHPARFMALDILGASVSGPLTISVGMYAARCFGEPKKAVALAKDLLSRYSVWMYVALGLALAIAIARWLRRRRREEGG
jgi:membrane protein DedA with SNARE-associated domain